MRRGSTPWAVLTIACIIALATLPACASQGEKKIVVEHSDEDPGWLWITQSDEGEHAWLGVVIQNLDEKLRSKYDIDSDLTGVLVSETNKDSPAEKAGIKSGDVIVEIADDVVDDIDELVEAIVSREPGDNVEIKLWRDGSMKTVRAELAAKAGQKYKRAYHIADALKALDDLDIVIPQIPHLYLGVSGIGGKGRLGVYIDEINGDLAEYFEIPDGKGVLVEGIVEGSPAEKAGIKAGDIILEIDGERIEDLDDLTDEISEMETDAETPIVILRKGDRLTLTAVVGESVEEQIEKIYKEQLKLSRDKHDKLIRAFDMSDIEKEELEEAIQELKEEIKRLQAELEEMKTED